MKSNLQPILKSSVSEIAEKAKCYRAAATPFISASLIAKDEAELRTLLQDLQQLASRVKEEFPRESVAWELITILGIKASVKEDKDKDLHSSTEHEKDQTDTSPDKLIDQIQSPVKSESVSCSVVVSSTTKESKHSNKAYGSSSEVPEPTNTSMPSSSDQAKPVPGLPITASPSPELMDMLSKTVL